MIKKSVIIIVTLLVILMFVSTVTASLSSPLKKFYERFPENSVFKKTLSRLPSFESVNNDDVIIDVDGDNGETDDRDDIDDGDNGETDDGDNGDNGDDCEYDDGEHDDEIDPDGPNKKGVDNLLPKIWEVGFYWTPDGGNEPVVEPSNTIDTPDGYEDGVSSGDGTIDYPDGATQDEWTVDSDGDEGATNEIITIDEDGTEDVTIEQLIEVTTSCNVEIGTMLQRVVEHTYAPGTTESTGVAENIVDTVVVAGGSVGTAENTVSEVVVLTAGD